MEANDPPFFYVIIGTMGMGMLIASILAFVVIHQRKMVEQRQKLMKQQFKATIAAQEEVSQRIARDLHDDIGGSLTTAKWLASRIQPSKSEDKLQEIRGQLKHTLGDAIEKIRSISRELMPKVLLRSGLPGGIQFLVDQHRGLDLHFTVNIQEDIARFDPEVEIALYRVLRELMTNTLKHADARHITISLTVENEGLKMTYADDGRGFDSKIGGHASGNGLGLSTIQSRLSLINGQVDLFSEPDKGMMMSLLIPSPDRFPQ